MKKYRKILAAIAVLMVFAGCTGRQDKSEETVYEDMKETFEKSGLLSSNIGIFLKTESEDSVSYGGLGSGVIIEREGDTYYALTSAHVVADESAEILVFTVNNEMKEEEIPGADMIILSGETYESMIPAEKFFASDRDDVAVIRFSCKEDLSVIEIAEADPKIDDRILCVGNPQSEWFRISYGKVTSGMETFGEAHGFPSNVMKHSAYMHEGSSGGAALNEGMKLAGITPGGFYSADGKDFRNGTLIPASEIKLCLEDWK